MGREGARPRHYATKLLAASMPFSMSTALGACPWAAFARPPPRPPQASSDARSHSSALRPPCGYVAGLGRQARQPTRMRRETREHRGRLAQTPEPGTRQRAGRQHQKKPRASFLVGRGNELSFLSPGFHPGARPPRSDPIPAGGGYRRRTDGGDRTARERTRRI